MGSKDKTEGVLDITEVGVVVAGAAIGGPLGAALGAGGVAVNKLGKVLHIGREARAARFLIKVAHYLEEHDPEGAAEFIASNAEKPEFADTVARGYEEMRHAFDPVAEECICLLTADHARQGRPVDRRFVRAATLLEICDLPMLRTLDLIATAYVSAVGDACAGDHRILFDRHAKGEHPASFFVDAYDGPTTVGMSEEIPAHENLRRALVHLAQHDYGLTWQGGGASPAEERLTERGSPSCRHHFKASDDESMRALHRYLAPVRRK